LGQRIGVSKSQVNRYENKGIQPPADILSKIADLFGTSVDFLINGQSEEKVKATLKNAELLKQFKQVEDLPEEDRLTVIKFLGAYLRDFKAKQAYAS
jgi:transcriptional regulator with XRE-family HTH domain